jgi:predicted cation transporter
LEHIPENPVLYMVIGLVIITLTVLILPFRVKRVEENLEAFFLIMGIAAVSVSGLWSWELVKEALRAPVQIGGLPIGIFQVVLVFGLLMYYFNRPFCDAVLFVSDKLGPRLFIFLFIMILGMLSSIVSVIVTAVLLAEVIAILPFSKSDKIKMTVVTCFAVGLGAALTPLGEPLSTILVHKLSGPPYNAGFLFPLRTFGEYVIPGVVAIALFGATYLGGKVATKAHGHAPEHYETLRSTVMRAVEVYIFIAALILLGEGLKPLIIWYLEEIPSWGLYWINIISAVLDNATLTAVEIGPTLTESQIISATMALLVAGGMLIPGNIPNIVSAGRLKISMNEWAKIGLPMGLVIITIYFIVMVFTHF